MMGKGTPDDTPTTLFSTREAAKHEFMTVRSLRVFLKAMQKALVKGFLHETPSVRAIQGNPDATLWFPHLKIPIGAIEEMKNAIKKVRARNRPSSLFFTPIRRAEEQSVMLFKDLLARLYPQIKKVWLQNVNTTLNIQGEAGVRVVDGQIEFLISPSWSRFVFQKGIASVGGWGVITAREFHGITTAFVVYHCLCFRLEPKDGIAISAFTEAIGHGEYQLTQAWKFIVRERVADREILVIADTAIDAVQKAKNGIAKAVLKEMGVKRK